jgi:hypothetical protein
VSVAADAWQQLLAVADRLEPEARARFLAAIAQLREAIDVGAIAEAVANRDPITAQVLGVVDHQFAVYLDPLLDTMQRAFIDVGRLSASQLTELLGATAVRFDVVDPLAASFATQQVALLVKQITQETQAAIQTVIGRAFTDGLTRRDAAALIRPLIGLTERQALAVFNYREGLTENGVAASRAETLVAQYAARQLRRRADTIARTELMAASHAAQHALWQQAADKGLLEADRTRRKWIVTPDDRLCRVCQPLGDQVRALDEPFESPIDGRTVLTPPLHPNCRCTLALVFSRRAAA